jgi:hypothetical protein
MVLAVFGASRDFSDLAIEKYVTYNPIILKDHKIVINAFFASGIIHFFRNNKPEK